MSLSRYNRAGLVAACAASVFLCGHAQDEAAAAIITYEYNGVVTSPAFGGAFLGQPITGLFTVDTSAPMELNAMTTRHENTFNVLSASVTFVGNTFHSRPYEDFDQGAAPVTNNRNLTQIFAHPSGYTVYDITTQSVEQIGNMKADTMTLQIQDRLTGASVIPEYPADLSAYSFGPDMDLALLSLGMTINTSGSTIVSAWGSITVVPAPGALALFAAAAPFAARRRRA